VLPLRLIAAAPLLAGCSLIYDADDLRHQGHDAAVIHDATVPIDVDPGALALWGSSPEAVLEGAGAGGGRPALIVIDGQALDADLLVSAALVDDSADAGAGAPVDVVGAVVATDGTQLAVALTIPVLEDLDQGQARQLAVTVTRSDLSERATIELEVGGLDELVPEGATLEVGSLAARYSRAVFAGDLQFLGSTPVRIRTTAEILIGGALDVSAVGVTPGPAGCIGGAANQVGQCSPGGGGGGGALLAAPGGGGGGFGEVGTSGTGTSAGGGGGVTGDPMLIPFGTDGNTGNGGGGGGGLLDLPGGPGGAGGGVIELSAGGQIVVTEGGAVAARGGDGGTGLGGGGGGGSGGAILARAAAGLEVDHDWLDAGGGGAQTRGGPGSVGRIRIDTPGALVDRATPDAARGPSWATDAPTIVQTDVTTLRLDGDGLRVYAVRVNDGEPTTASGGDDVEVELQLGLNEICAIAAPEAPVLTAEGVNCITVARLP
jgi:hypothetical protein